MNTLDIYKALSDESRLRIVHILSRGYFNVGELRTILDLGQSTVSHHLKILGSAGLTKMHKEGTWAYYTLESGDENSHPAKTIKTFLETAESSEDDVLGKLLLRDAVEVKKIINRRRDRTHGYFESVAGEWKEIRNEAQGQESFLELVASRVPMNATLLELGCGTGALLEHLLPRNGRTIGVDYSQAMLDEAKQNLGARAENSDLRLGYLEHLPLGDGSVDIAVAYMVLHHVPNPIEALRDASRVLHEQGTLVIVDLLTHDNEYMKERYADLWLGFDPEEIIRWAKECGFKTCDAEVLGIKEEVFILTCNK